jgi:hypothetical protein
MDFQFILAIAFMVFMFLFCVSMWASLRSKITITGRIVSTGKIIYTPGINSKITFFSNIVEIAEKKSTYYIQCGAKDVAYFDRALEYHNYL